MGTANISPFSPLKPAGNYSVYDRQFSEIDGGDIDLKHITIQQCRDMLLQDLGWQDRSFVPMDYEMG